MEGFALSERSCFKFKSSPLIDASSNSTSDLIVSCTSDNKVVLVDSNLHLTHTFDLNQHVNFCVNSVSFSKVHPNLFAITGQSDFFLCVDSRIPSQNFVVKSPNSHHLEYTCVDFSDQLIATGTAVDPEENAYVLFWDVRNLSCLGYYSESHSDDVIDVEFHPYKFNLFASGSIDGLLNVYDLNNEKEEEALLATANCESPIHRATWEILADDFFLVAITFNNELYAFNCESQNFDARFYCDVDGIFGESKRNLTRVVNSDYFLLMKRFFSNKNEAVFLVSGSNTGDLRLHSVHNEELTLTDVRKDAHSDLIRAAVSFQEDSFITASEDGLLKLWTLVNR